jgi:hypothetical protein
VRDESDPSAQLQRKEDNSSFPDLLYKLQGWAVVAQPLLFWAVTICFLLGMLSAIHLVHNQKEITMKTITASLFALVLSAPFALANGCGMHGEQEASMSCITGQAWDAEAKQCVDTSA